MILKNALLYTPEHTFVPGDLAVRDGRISADLTPQPGEEVIDAGGLYALPAPWATISATLPRKPSRPWLTLRPARASWPSAPPP